MAKDRGLFPLIMEGDSQIIINMSSKLMQGSPVHKISSSWRLANRLELLKNWLTNHPAISFKHIRREGNKLADFIANLGVEWGREFYEGPISDMVSENQLSTFRSIVVTDMQRKEALHPDADRKSVV